MQSYDVMSSVSIRARCTTLCDKVCQWLVTGRWFFSDAPVSSTNKTDRHDIAKILLKVALNTIKQANNLLPKNVVMGLVLVLRIYELIWFSFEEIYECRVFFKFKRQHCTKCYLKYPLSVFTIIQYSHVTPPPFQVL